MGLLVGALVPASAATERTAVDADDAPLAQVAAAIAKFVGHSEKELPSEEYKALDASLEGARKVLYDNRAVALDAILPLLASETRDSFLMIELAADVAVMESDENRLAVAAAAVQRADVRRHPAATIRALAWMGSRGCGPCLPAMFRVLEAHATTVIPESGLLLGGDSAFLFIFGQYGPAALPGLVDRLESEDCGVRTTAVRALRWVRPAVIPPALRALTLDRRNCHSARREAWYILGELDDPEMPVLARRRLDASPPPDGHERAEIAYGLVSSFVPTALEVLESMREDPSPRVQPLVRSGLSPEREMDTLLERSGGRPDAPVRPEDRARRLRALEEGAATGLYKMEEPFQTFVPSMTLEDIPLIERTRASVLHRLTEDAHLHAVRLTMLVRSLRFVHAGPPIPIPPQVKAAPSKLPMDVEAHFMNRYGKETSVVSYLKETPDGPLGTLSVYGDLKVENSGGPGREERARAATLAFLKQEADLLGIRDFAEIRETRLMFDEGACYVDYDRNLGGIPLVWNTYGFRLKPDGTIGQFNAAVVPVSSGLDAAVRHRKISAEKVRKIVERDFDALGLAGASFVTGEPALALAAYYAAPFVLWEMRGRYSKGSEQVALYYGIDAITGDIVRRNCSNGRLYSRAPSGHEPGPCDSIPEIPTEPSALPNPFQHP
jgi:HEAT repeat protein